MMNKKIFAVVVPVAAFTALAGTGFSAWYFGGSVGANNGFGTNGAYNGGADVVVAPEINASDVNVVVSGLSTDAEGKVDTKLWLDDAASTNPYAAKQDIYLAKTDYYNTADKTNFKAELPSFTFNLASSASTLLSDYSVTYSVTLSENLAEYVSVAYDSNIAVTGASASVTPSVTFSYIEGKKPTNHDELAAMKAAVAGAKVTFAITVNSK